MWYNKITITILTMLLFDFCMAQKEKENLSDMSRSSLKKAASLEQAGIKEPQQLLDALRNYNKVLSGQIETADSILRSLENERKQLEEGLGEMEELRWENFEDFFKNKSFKELCNSKALIENFVRLPETEDKIHAGLVERANVYLLLIRIDSLVNSPYKESVIEEMKSKLESVADTLIYTEHKEDFEKLSIQLKRYKFGLFELKRVIASMDDKESEEVMVDANIRYIVRIPYLKNLLEKYREAESEDEKNKIKDSLKEMCPELYE